MRGSKVQIAVNMLLEVFLYGKHDKGVFKMDEIDEVLMPLIESL